MEMTILAGLRFGAIFSWERFSTSPGSGSAQRTNTGRRCRRMTTLRARWMRRDAISRNPTNNLRVGRPMECSKAKAEVRRQKKKGNAEVRSQNAEVGSQK